MGEPISNQPGHILERGRIGITYQTCSFHESEWQVREGTGVRKDRYWFYLNHAKPNWVLSLFGNV